jgi:hypothetical protein
MKFLFLLIFTPLFSIAQDTTEVVKVDSVTAAILYSRAKLFIAETFKSYKDVVQLNEDETKTVITKPIIKTISKGFLSGGLQTYIHYTLKIENKEGRYRYSFTNFAYQYMSNVGLTTERTLTDKANIYSARMWDDVKKAIADEEVIIISKLKSGMFLQKNTDF